MRVSSILRRKGTHVETTAPDTTVADAARLLCEKGIGSLVILDLARNVAGVLTERDLVRAFSEHGARALSLPIRALLTGPPAICRPDDSLEQVMASMTVRRARHLPVVAGDALVGIVSIGDVVKSQLDDLKLEVGVLRDYARARR